MSEFGWLRLTKDHRGVLGKVEVMVGQEPVAQLPFLRKYEVHSPLDGGTFVVLYINEIYVLFEDPGKIDPEKMV